MSEQTPLLALFKLSQQFKPQIEQLGGRLLKVVFEWEGRSVTYNHDEREFPNADEEPRTMLQAPPPPTPAPPSGPSLPPRPFSKPAAAPPSTQLIMVDGFSLPIPPCAGMTSPSQPAPPPPPAPPNKRHEPIEGIVPLTDDDICPIQKKHPNTRLADVPSDYLDWLLGQPWLKTKYPQLWAYVIRHKDVIQKDISN